MLWVQVGVEGKVRVSRMQALWQGIVRRRRLWDKAVE